MIKSINVLKKYYSLANVKPVFLLLEFLFLFVPAIVSIVSPIIIAKVISSITVFDFQKATRSLIFDFVLILLSSLSYFFYHIVSSKTNKTIAMNFETYIYQNAKQNKNLNHVNFSTLSNVWKCVDFNKNLLYKMCFFIKSVALIVIISYFNFFIGLILIFVSIISYFLFSITDNKIQFLEKQKSKQLEQSHNLFNSIKKGLSAEECFGLETPLKDKYFAYVHQNINNSNKTSLLFSINNNFITLILKTAVFASTIYLIQLVKSTTLTLSFYLILTPYLTTSAQNLISFFGVFSEIGAVDNILQEFDCLKFSSTPKEEKPIELSAYNLYFFQVGFSGKEFPSLSNFNLDINHKSFINIVGSQTSGRHTLFEFLKKTTKPTSGSILLDNKNIFDIPPETYNKTISITNKKPHFYNVSVFENLFMVCENKTKINHAIKLLGLKNTIDLLPQKINTVCENLNVKTTFLLGLLRSFLSGTQIIAINEIPEGLEDDDISLLEHIFKILNKTKTVILFSQKPTFENLATKIILVKNNTSTPKNL